MCIETMECKNSKYIQSISSIQPGSQLCVGRRKLVWCRCLTHSQASTNWKQRRLFFWLGTVCVPWQLVDRVTRQSKVSAPKTNTLSRYTQSELFLKQVVTHSALGYTPKKSLWQNFCHKIVFLDCFSHKATLVLPDGVSQVSDLSYVPA